ncbi:lumenal Hsp70 protein, partial [Spiromyces aspiralis]
SGRKPENTFLNIKQLVGKAFDDPAAQAYRERYANRMVKGETLSRSIQFEIGGDEETTLTVQEIIAMQLQHAQKLVQEAEGVAARDAIIAIPSFYNPDQRQAVINAADIAGLHLIALINDGSAVALNYGMSREFSEEPEYHIFYDMGAGNTVVTAASFTQRKVNKKHQPIEVNILATSHDSTLGGSDIDVRLREFMLRAFEGAHKADTTRPIRENKRAMAKLLKEAARVKAILSVNAETVASVESLHEDIDFRAKVTREDLEDAIKDLGQRARAPLEAVIRAANLTIGEIGSVVLVGGSSRVPFIQNVIAGIVTKDKLARHLDADEACVVGTAFYGASMSRQFRVKDIQLNDVSSNAYQATFTPEEPGRESTSEIPLHSPIKLKRTIQDTRASDLKLAVDYYSGEEEQWVNFMEIAVTGAASSVNEVADRQHLVSETPLVKVQLAVNEYGMLGVVRAMAIYNSTNPAYE